MIFPAEWISILDFAFKSEERGYAHGLSQDSRAIVKEALIKCVCGILRKFCGIILLQFLEIHQVFLRNCAAFCRKIFSQSALADLISPSLNIKCAYDRIGAETEFVAEEPASVAEVEAVENGLGRKLPLQIREFFLQYSRKCEFSAFLPDDVELPSELDEIFSAGFLISLEELVNAERSRKDYVEECFTNEAGAYDAVWHYKFSFVSLKG